MHFEWQLTLGQIVVTVPILWIVWVLAKIDRMMFRFIIEHEILMKDWANRQTPPIKVEDLPTRTKSRWF
jgi:hypothetical protein